MWQTFPSMPLKWYFFLKMFLYLVFEVFLAKIKKNKLGKVRKADEETDHFEKKLSSFKRHFQQS